MIKSFQSFKELNENKYADLKSEYNSLGEYVEHLYSILDNEEDKDKFERILGEFLKVPKKKYNTKKFEVGDYVLIEYWYKDIITPVKLIEKNGRKFIGSHDIEESEIRNAPNEELTKDMIIDHFNVTKDNKKEKNIPTDIRISNSVNMLKNYDAMLLVKRLQEEFDSKLEEAHKFELEETKNISLLGQFQFGSFLKILSALSLPNIEIDRDNCPRDFFLIFITEKINRDRFFEILKRFRSMNPISDLLSQTNDPLRVYFGLKYNNQLMLEYGVIKGDNRVAVGEYKLSKNNWVKLKNKESKVLKSLQEQIEHIDIKDLRKLMKIKSTLTNFSPGYYSEKSNPYIENNTLVQGYKGNGKWIDNTITTDSYTKLKKTFKDWVLTQKWSKDIVFNIKSKDYWHWIKIKLK